MRERCSAIGGCVHEKKCKYNRNIVGCNLVSLLNLSIHGFAQEAGHTFLRQNIPRDLAIKDLKKLNRFFNSIVMEIYDKKEKEEK